MRIPQLAIIALAAIGGAALRPVVSQVSVPAEAASVACAPAGVTYTRTTLYFGLAHPAGTISEREWKLFLREEVTPRFPRGFTSWEAEGQWRNGDGRIAREPAKVLLIVHAGTQDVRDALIGLVERYKQTFRQESVLWESAAVCAAF
jgi:hypothetical protein